MGNRIEDHPEGTVIIFDEPISLDESAGLKTALSERLGRGVRRFVADLSRVDVITTPGLGLLVSLHRTIMKENGRFLVAGLSPYVREVFDLTRLTKILETKNDVKEALSAE